MSYDDATTLADDDEVGRQQDGAADAGYFECPECGEQLADMRQREKHGILHYGDDLIPPYPDNNLAAERKAALLNVEPETLRGFPRRRY